MKRNLFLGLALVATIVLASPAYSGKRVRAIDSTDPAIKEFCRKNPDKCTTQIDWGGSIRLTLIAMGIFVGIPFGIRVLSLTLNPTPLHGEKNYKKPSDYQ
jgi:hypothetical protein